MFGLSPGHLLLLLLVVVLIFGTKKLRHIGEDLGAAVKSFRKGIQEGGDKAEPQKLEADSAAPVSAETDKKSDSTS
jgi:sec-independent protein translocase protein TatA